RQFRPTEGFGNGSEADLVEDLAGGQVDYRDPAVADGVGRLPLHDHPLRAEPPAAFTGRKGDYPGTVESAVRPVDFQYAEGGLIGPATLGPGPPLEGNVGPITGQGEGLVVPLDGRPDVGLGHIVEWLGAEGVDSFRGGRIRDVEQRDLETLGGTSLLIGILADTEQHAVGHGVQIRREAR